MVRTPFKIHVADRLDISSILEHQKRREFIISLANSSAELPDWQRDKDVWNTSQKKLSSAVDSGNLIVARGDNDDVVGYALLREHLPGKWEIELINVLQDMEGRGIGTELVKRAEAHVRFRNGNEIRVKPDVIARGFWPKMGYEPRGGYHVKECRR